MTLDRDVTQKYEREWLWPTLLGFDHGMESPSCSIVLGHEVLLGHPSFPLIRMPFLGPPPQGSEDVVIDIAKGPFAHTVSVVVAPAPKPGIERVDHCRRARSDIRPEPSTDFCQQSVHVLLLWHRIAATVELSDMEAEEVDALANMLDAGFLPIQFQSSLFQPVFQRWDNGFDVLPGLSGYQ